MATVESKSKKTNVENRARSSKVESPWRIVGRRLRRNKLAMIGLIVLLIMALGAIFAPFLTDFGRDETNLLKSNAKPDDTYILGADALGRDILTRLLYGGRISLTVGFVSTGLRIVIGVILGGIAGYYGKWIDGLIMR